MSLVYSFDTERFKPLVAAYLNAGFDFNEISPELKKPMRLYIHENIPHIHLSDGFHFIESHFTKDAINEFRKNHSNTKFTSLRDKILVVTRWRLVKKNEDSRKVITSYQNISVHFVVESFRPLLYEKPQPKQVAETTCLYKDAEIQTLVKSVR
jgi:Telomere-binding protein beta subunit (TEBP beta)